MKQSTALEILKTGRNVFLTGEPGAGKTFVINKYVDWLKRCKLNVAITASTGVAATHIGGTTIHAWSGIGLKKSLSEVKSKVKYKAKQKIREVDVLIIDEISMVNSQFLDLLDDVLKFYRRNGYEAFGGVQIVFVGDFFQLPPVMNRDDEDYRDYYAFKSDAWKQANLITCYITEQYRQEDPEFLDLLRSIRNGKVKKFHYNLLSQQKGISDSEIENYTKLYTHNKNVDNQNKKELRKLDGESVLFEMKAEGNEELTKLLIKNCMSPKSLELREGAIVMFTKNNFSEGYVNGTIGKVIKFDEARYPMVKTISGKKIMVDYASWEIEGEKDKPIARISQLPLRLAWAITVHKSQGISLDVAEIDLSSSFVEGQGYVAISRVRSLKGLNLKGINRMALQVCDVIKDKDKEFRKKSYKMEEWFKRSFDIVLKRQKEFVKTSGGKFIKQESIIIEENLQERVKNLVLKEFSITQISEKLKISENSTCNHIEEMVNKQAIYPKDLRYFVTSNWVEMCKDVFSAFKNFEDEKLIPIYKFLDKKYDYKYLKIIRALYSKVTIKTNDSKKGMSYRKRFNTAKELILKKASIKEISETTNVTESTVCSYIVKLIKNEQLYSRNLRYLKKEDWDKEYDDICNAFDICGINQLKSVYELLNEKYTYNYIKIIRALYLQKR